MPNNIPERNTPQNKSEINKEKENEGLAKGGIEVGVERKQEGRPSRGGWQSSRLSDWILTCPGLWGERGGAGLCVGRR